MLWKRDLNLTLNYWAAIFKWTYLRAPLELVGQMDIRKSVGKHSKSIGDVYGDARAANRVGIVWIFFVFGFFFLSSFWEISLGSTTQIHKPTHVVRGDQSMIFCVGAIVHRILTAVFLR